MPLLNFTGSVEDIGHAYFNEYDLSAQDVAYRIWEQGQALRDSPAEDYLRGQPYYGSGCRFHYSQKSSNWLDEPTHNMWSINLQDVSTIRYHHNCPFGGYSATPMILRLQEARTKDFCGVQVVHLDQNIAQIGGLGAMVYGNHQNALCPINEGRKSGHCVIGVGHEAMLRAYASSKDGIDAFGCIALDCTTLPLLKDLDVNGVTKITIAIPDTDNAVISGRQLLELLEIRRRNWSDDQRPFPDIELTIAKDTALKKTSPRTMHELGKSRTELERNINGS